MTKLLATLGHRAPRSRERGAVLILFVVGMVAILGIAGLALDSGHGVLNKTRLQNTVDAAALNAAKTLSQTSDTMLATADAISIFSDNADGNGNAELARSYNNGDITVTVEFSSTLNPFVPGTVPAEYVRVRATGFTLSIWFSALMGLTDKQVAASAVAGPSPTIDVEACNLMPMMVCGDPDAGGPYWGYTPNEPDVLKSSASNGDFDVGPGNFQLIRLGDGQGGSVVREAMAGNYDACLASDEVIETEPGNTIGPVAQGLNTRFGIWDGPMSGEQATYPPDVVTEQPDPPLTYDVETDTIHQGTEVMSVENQPSFDYEDYGQRTVYGPHNFSPDGIGRYLRREAAIAIGDCSDTTNGQGQVPLLGFGCFFLLQEVSQQGNDAFVYGTFIENCNAGGVPGPDPIDTDGPFIIQLYRDFSSPEA